MTTLSHDIMVAMHRGDLTPAQAFALQAERDAATATKQPTPTPAEGRHTAPDLCIYTPYSATGNLGEAYNRVMARLAPGEWAVFLDHDAMTLTNEFWPDLQHAVATHPDAGAICCWSNRVGNPAQKAKCPDGDDLAAHTARAVEIRREYGQSTTDITGDRLTGVCFAVSRAAWDKAGPFAAGFGEVDTTWARQCQAAGLRVWRMDGVYVYHQRRTNGWKGATRPEIGCKGVSWTYAAVAPVIAAHGDQTLRDLAAAHTLLVESRTDWSDCQKSARRKTLMAHWRASLRLSVVIPSREEDPAELAGTVKTFRDGGAQEIIVVDDASTEPVADNCGADLIIRHDAAHGVAASRNEGLRHATGNVIGFSDSHCRIAPGCDLLNWAYAAYCSDDLLCAVCGSYEDADKWFYGSSLPWSGWRYDISANLGETARPQAPFGSVYSAARWTWERLGGWMPTRGWGYNEQALGLLCRHTATAIRVEPWFRIRHRFRKRFPYAVSNKDFQANAPWVHWLLSTDDEWAALRPAIAAAKPEALQRAETWMQEAGAIDVRQGYRARHRAEAAAPIATTAARKTTSSG